MHDESPISVSELLSRHIEEALRIRHTRKRYAAFRSALADVLGLPRADLGIIAVRNVSQTLHRRLEDGPSSPVTVLILKTQDASKVKKEVLKAKDRIYQALNIGDPPRRTAIIYAREEDGKTPTWTVKAVVEAVAKGARRLTADSVGQYYPQAERTLVLADRGRAAMELAARVR